jgi:hypothetical protein
LPGLYNFEEIGYPCTFVGFTTASAMLHLGHGILRISRPSTSYIGILKFLPERDLIRGTNNQIKLGLNSGTCTL